MLHMLINYKCQGSQKENKITPPKLPQGSQGILLGDEKCSLVSLLSLSSDCIDNS